MMNILFNLQSLLTKNDTYIDIIINIPVHNFGVFGGTSVRPMNQLTLLYKLQNRLHCTLYTV